MATSAHVVSTVSRESPSIPLERTRQTDILCVPNLIWHCVIAPGTELIAPVALLSSERVVWLLSLPPLLSEVRRSCRREIVRFLAGNRRYDPPGGVIQQIVVGVIAAQTVNKRARRNAMPAILSQGQFNLSFSPDSLPPDTGE